MKRYLEYKDDTSNKFWEITWDNNSYTVRYGKIGASGTSKTTSCSNPEDEVIKLVSSKIKKGYKEIGTNTDEVKEEVMLVDDSIDEFIKKMISKDMTKDDGLELLKQVQEKSEDLKHKMYDEICEKANADIIFLIATVYFDQINLAKTIENKQKGIEYFDKAASLGHVEGMYKYAFYTIYNNPKEIAKCIEYLEEAVKHNHVQSMFLLALQYLSSDHIPRDYEKGLKLLDEPIKQNVNMAKQLKHEGSFRYERHKDEQLLESYKNNPTKEQIEEITNIGHEYYRGARINGAPLDYYDFFPICFLEFGLKHNNSLAKCLYGACLCNGMGVTADAPKGIEMMKEALEEGCAKAYGLLAYYYYAGIGVTKSYVRAKEYAEQGVIHKDCLSYTNLSSLYEDGTLGLDIKKAYELLVRAKKEVLIQFNDLESIEKDIKGLEKKLKGHNLSKLPKLLVGSSEQELDDSKLAFASARVLEFFANNNTKGVSFDDKIINLLSGSDKDYTENNFPLKDYQPYAISYHKNFFEFADNSAQSINEVVKSKVAKFKCVYKDLELTAQTIENNLQYVASYIKEFGLSIICIKNSYIIVSTSNALNLMEILRGYTISKAYIVESNLEYSFKAPAVIAQEDLNVIYDTLGVSLKSEIAFLNDYAKLLCLQDLDQYYTLLYILAGYENANLMYDMNVPEEFAHLRSSDELEYSTYVLTNDWKDGLEEFFDQVSGTVPGLRISEQKFYGRNIGQYLNELDDMTRPLGYSVVTYNTGSDQYVYSIIQTNKLEAFEKSFDNIYSKCGINLIHSGYDEYVAEENNDNIIYLEFVDGTSSKFWEVKWDSKSYTVRYGKIGSDGTSKKTACSNPSEEANKLAKAKIKKGYSNAVK